MRFGQGADCAAVAMLVIEALRALMGLLWGVDSRKELAFIPFSQVGEYRGKIKPLYCVILRLCCFSPVCINMWVLRFEEVVKAFPHWAFYEASLQCVLAYGF